MASHRVSGRNLSRYKDHRKALLRGLTADLIKHERIKTTLAKAKETRIVAEKLITHGKKGTLHHRRLALSQLPNKQVEFSGVCNKSKTPSVKTKGFLKSILNSLNITSFLEDEQL